MDHNKNLHSILTKFNKADLLLSLEYVIIVPLNGCGSCFDRLQEFIINNNLKIKNKCLIIFTNFTISKEINILFGEKYSSEYMVKDRDGYVMDLKYNVVHPSYFKIENKKVQYHKYLDPSVISIQSELSNIKNNLNE